MGESRGGREGREEEGDREGEGREEGRERGYTRLHTLRDVVLAIIMSNQWKSALRNTTRLPNGKDTTPTRRLIKKMPGMYTQYTCTVLNLFCIFD